MLVDHVAFRVPDLVLPIAMDVDKLLQDGKRAAVTLLCEPASVVFITIHVAVRLVIRVVLTEYLRAGVACEVFDMVFLVKCCKISEQRLGQSCEEKGGLLASETVRGASYQAEQIVFATLPGVRSQDSS